MRSDRARRLLLVGAGSAMLMVCSPRVDPLDAGPDAAGDARAPRDAFRGRDVGRDVGPDAFVPTTWVPVTGGWPAECDVQLASAESVAATAFTTTPCDDMPGCRAVSFPRFARFVAVEVFEVEAGAAFTVLESPRVGIPDVLVEWTFRWDGPALIGLRSPFQVGGVCYAVMQGRGVDRAAFLVHPPSPDGYVLYEWAAVVAYADPDTAVDLGRISRVARDYDYPSSFAIGDAHYFAQMALGGSVWEFDATGAPTQLWGGGTDGRIASLDAVIGDTLFFDIYESSGRPYAMDIRVRRPGEPIEPMFDDGLLRASMVGDGTDLAWIQFLDWNLGSGGGTADLYTAPYVERAADLVPRRLTRMQARGNSTMMIGEGYAAVGELAGIIGIYRLRDGARAELVAPSRMRWLHPHGIHGGEILVSYGDRTVFPFVTARMMFVRLDALDFVSP